MTTLVVFDIEAVPDFEAARRLFGQFNSMPHAEIRRMLGQRYSRDGEDPTTAFLKVPVTGSSASPPSTPSGKTAARGR